MYSSVPDPIPDSDPPYPHVFWPPGSGSGSTSQRYGSGSRARSGFFYQHAKIIRKTLNPTIMYINVPSKSNKQKNCVKN